MAFLAESQIQGAGSAMTKQEVIRPVDESGRIVKEAYYQAEYLALEKERLWPRVWQMACREEEIPEVGDYLTYEIADESIVVVRAAPDRLNAFFNVCRHRGRRITKGCGSATRLRCPFHGWQWDLEGRNTHVTQKEDWGGLLDNEDLSLPAVKCETWGGWVWINMDPDAEPLMDWLGEAAEALAPFQLDKMRYGWRKWMVIKCNWKIGLEAFNEGYHVGITHNQLIQFSGHPHFQSAGHGPHGTFGAAVATGTLGGRVAGATNIDAREKLAGFYNYQKWGLNSLMTDTLVNAANRLMDELPADTPPPQVVQHLMASAIRDDAARGVQWPVITPEEYARAGTDWHIFPNMVLLPMATNCLGYRARPNGDDPDSCIFEVYHIERYPEGEEPKNVQNERNDDVYDQSFWGEILPQDFQQMEGTHRGVKSRSYKGPRLNPQQETPLANFHRAYHELIARP
jgi:phenylpropionate dioxygenase-like ring-hydroxylating dioxygenase large terminal subunit